jgi:hypothetical protein
MNLQCRASMPGVVFLFWTCRPPKIFIRTAFTSFDYSAFIRDLFLRPEIANEGRMLELVEFGEWHEQVGWPAGSGKEKMTRSVDARQ